MRRTAVLALVGGLVACGGPGLKANVVRSKAAGVRPATAADVEIYFYEKEPPYEAKPVGTIDLSGTFAEGTPMEDQEWELRERLESEARALGGDTVIVMSSVASPAIEVKALALAYSGKGKRPPYEGKLGKKARPARAKKGKGAPKKKGPATSAVDDEVPAGMTE